MKVIVDCCWMREDHTGPMAITISCGGNQLHLTADVTAISLALPRRPGFNHWCNAPFSTPTTEMVGDFIKRWFEDLAKEVHSHRLGVKATEQPQ